MKHYLTLIAFIFTLPGLYAQTNTFPTSGNVGIGTTTPSNDLQVNGTTRTNNLMVGQSSLTDNTGTVTTKMGRATGDKVALWLTDNNAENSLHGGGFDGAMLSVHSSSISNSVMVNNAYSGAKNLKVGTGATYFGLGNLIYYGQTRGGVNTDQYTFYSHAYNQFASNSNSTGFSSGGQLAATGQDVNTHTDFFAKNFDAISNGTIGTRYGLHLAFNGTNTTNAYGVYQSSDDVKNFFNGNVGIGTATPAHQFEVKDSSPTPAVLINNIGNDRRQGIAVQNTNAGTAAVALYKMYSASSGTGSGDGADIGVTNASYNQINYGSPGGNAMVLWNYENGGMVLGTNNTEKVRILPTGEVGIGTNSPNYELDVAGTINATSILINGQPISAGTPSPWAISGSNAFFNTGNIGIGIDNPQNKLDVNGTIHAREVKVDLTGWPDYVFTRDYNLQPLAEVKDYIEQNQHLPEMPSATEVETNGVMLGEMNKLLLKKVEELTLHLIRQQEEIDALKKEVHKR